MMTRNEQLWYFRTWMENVRPKKFSENYREEVERYIRFFMIGRLDQKQEREFKKWMKTKCQDLVGDQERRKSLPKKQ